MVDGSTYTGFFSLSVLCWTVVALLYTRNVVMAVYFSWCRGRILYPLSKNIFMSLQAHANTIHVLHHSILLQSLMQNLEMLSVLASVYNIVKLPNSGRLRPWIIYCSIVYFGRVQYGGEQEFYRIAREFAGVMYHSLVAVIDSWFMQHIHPCPGRSTTTTARSGTTWFFSGYRGEHTI